jgi:hypothetical protein
MKSGGEFAIGEFDVVANGCLELGDFVRREIYGNYAPWLGIRNHDRPG